MAKERPLDRPADLASRLRGGDRRALARAITVIESSRDDHRAEAEALLAALLPATGGAIRIGISGVPGVGKSSFIERFGLMLVERGHRVAVLAVDPSSQRGGGAILGDKTRMPELSQRREAFIRPSPAGATLGGVARRSREALLLCEAAGFDVIVVETVGVGQAETAVADMVDLFLLLLLPSGGDELQGLKRGIMELAELIVVNKADGDLAAAARRTAAEYHAALGLLRPTDPRWQTAVMTCSAHTGAGIAEVWDAIGRFREAMAWGRPDGALAAKRRGQARAWLWREVGDGLMAALKADGGETGRIEAEVAAGRMTPEAGARTLIRGFLARSGRGRQEP
ncbi:MAG: methylmalonyl Co-A mutase-associated GTPase MeaB [Kiloniellales bacterium]|nr:methylmalonyl Co-A mutase-associated GTPase MeaB [Kiloniellales bacterium]